MATLGRESDVLYRGARLTQAQEWAGLHSEDMNALERGFLDASVAQAEHEANERHSQRQRELEAAQKLAKSENKCRGTNNFCPSVGKTCKVSCGSIRDCTIDGFHSSVFRLTGTTKPRSLHKMTNVLPHANWLRHHSTISMSILNAAFCWLCNLFQQHKMWMELCFLNLWKHCTVPSSPLPFE